MFARPDFRLLRVSRRHLRRDDEQADEKREMYQVRGIHGPMGNGTLRDSSEFMLRSILDVHMYVRHDAGFVTRSGFFEGSVQTGQVFRVGGDSRCNTNGAGSSTMILTPPPLSLSLSLSLWVSRLKSWWHTPSKWRMLTIGLTIISTAIGNVSVREGKKWHKDNWKMRKSCRHLSSIFNRHHYYDIDPWILYYSNNLLS